MEKQRKFITGLKTSAKTNGDVNEDGVIDGKEFADYQKCHLFVEENLWRLLPT